MTTLVVREHDNGCTIGFDATISQGDSGHQGDSDKVFVNNGVVIGVAGDVLVQNILRFAPLPSPEAAGWDTDYWLATQWIPAVRDALEVAGALRSESGQIAMNGHLLIVVNKRAYEIPGDLSFLRRADKTYCAGSGWQFAQGAMSAGASIRAALVVAAEHDLHTGGLLRVVQSDELLDEHFYFEERIAA